MIGKIITPLALSLAVFSQASAQAPDTFSGLPRQSARMYADYCSPISATAGTWCLGYIGGIASGLRATKQACIPDRIWGFDLLAEKEKGTFQGSIGTDYIRSHPEVAGQPAEGVLVNLLIQRWPCR
jgi:hypothetical protein